MRKPTLTGEFAEYGAKLVNPRWACSTIAEDGSMVLSGWSHLLTQFPNGLCRYKDNLSRWLGNKKGNELLRKHISQALDENLLVRLVVATADDPKSILSCDDASTFPKTFSAHENLTGKVVMFDGDTFIIDFEQN